MDSYNPALLRRENDMKYKYGPYTIEFYEESCYKHLMIIGPANLSISVIRGLKKHFGITTNLKLKRKLLDEVVWVYEDR